MANHFKDRTGFVFTNKQGEKAIVTKYLGANDVWVRFEGNDENELTHTTFSRCVSGYVKNPNYRSVYGVGFLGYGEYKSHVGGKIAPSYDYWSSILQRCYGTNDSDLSYKKCEVCEEWHNYQNFAKWFEENYYQIDGERMHLDKDWLIKGNQLYSPETCVFVPQSINGILVASVRKKTDKKLPIGVFKDKSGRYRAECNSKKRKNPYLGMFDTPEEAFQAYKEFKEQYIKEVAEDYKDMIPTKLYEAMIKWEV